MLQQLIADILDLSKIEARNIGICVLGCGHQPDDVDLEQQFRMRVAELE